MEKVTLIKFDNQIADLWRSDRDEELNHSFRNVHFIQDESGTDKLSFTVNADHPSYKQFHASIQNKLRLRYILKTDEQTEVIDKEYEFFIVIVDEDKFTKQKDVICASSMITFDWTPAMYKEKDGVGVALNVFSVRSSTGTMPSTSILSILANEVKEWHDEIDTTIGINSSSDERLDGAFSMSMDSYGQTYSTLRNELFEKTGLRIRREKTITSGGHPLDLYASFSHEGLQKDNGSDVILITETNAILSHKQTEDITTYYTHACGYVTPELQERKEGELVSGDTYRYRNDTVRVKTEAQVNKYGAKYMASAIDKDSFKSDLKSLKSAVRATHRKTSAIQINPYVLINHNIQIYNRLIVMDEDIGEVVALLVTKADKCLDDITASSFEVEDITDDFESVINIVTGRYDRANFARSTFSN